MVLELGAGLKKVEDVWVREKAINLSIATAAQLGASYFIVHLGDFLRL